MTSEVESSFVSILEAVTGAYAEGAYIRQQDRNQKWLEVSFGLGRIAPGDHILVSDIQVLGRLDCFLCALEKETVGLAKATSDSSLFAFELYTTLSTAWLSLCYERMRLIRQRIFQNSLFKERWHNAGLEDVFQLIERARVLELKREVPKGDDLHKRSQSLRFGIGDDADETYQHGNTVLNLVRGLDEHDGSLVWNAISIDVPHNCFVSRRGLSNELLDALLQWKSLSAG
ncbi:MAG: hypothetical protein V2I51_12935 [Anderseniella sp.]|jgi:hypothetical protein|nr:hypothetical protein [Anderseniella sp.]